MKFLGYFNFFANLAKRITQLGIVLIVVLFVVSAFVPKSSLTPLPISSDHTSEYASITQLRLDAVEAEFAKLEESTISAPIVGMIRGLNCKFAGVLCADKSISQDAHFAGSLMGYATLGVAYPLANPPASGAYYASSVMQQAGLVPNAYAWEGIGFSGLRAYLDIWVLFRNLAYMIFVIVLIVAGFAIMFQWKIGGKTAVTLENALVKIVFAMIVINFSYAIAGLLIDLMYVVMGVLVSFLGQGILVNGKPADAAYIAGLSNDFLNAGPSHIIDSLLGDGNLNGDWKSWLINGQPKIAALVGFLGLVDNNTANSILSFFVVPYRISLSVISVVPALLRWVLGIANVYVTHKLAAFTGQNFESLGGMVSGFSLAGFSPGFLPKLAGPIAYLLSLLALLGIGIPLILTLIVMLTFVIFWVRIIAVVFFTYIQIILSIMTAPLLLMTEAIPGQNRFANWIKGLIGHLSVFPVLTGTFLLARLLASRADMFKIGLAAKIVDPNEGLWTPPFLGDGYAGGIPINNGLDSGAFLFIVAMVVMFSAPEFIKLTKKAIGGGDSPVKFSPMALFGAAGIATTIPNLYSKAMFYGGLFPGRFGKAMKSAGDYFESKNMPWLAKKIKGLQQANEDGKATS